MIYFFKELKHTLQKKEINLLYLILFFLVLITFLDAISFVTIIPVVNFIFFEKSLNISFFSNNTISGLNDKFIILFIFGLIFIIKNFIIIIFNLYVTFFFKKMINRISIKVFAFFLNQEYKFFLNNSSKELLQKNAKDLNSLNIFFLSLVSLASEFIFFFAISCVLIFINLKIFLVVFFSFFISVILYFYIFRKRLKHWSYQSRYSSLNLNSIIMEGFAGFKDIIVYNLKNDFNAQFEQSTLVYNHAFARISFLNNVQKYWLEIVGILIMCFAISYLIFFRIEIIELIPILGVFVVAVFRILSSLNRIVVSFQNVKFYYPSFEAIAKECKKVEYLRKVELDANFNFENYIEFSNVSFRYSKSQNILNKVNLKIYKNQCVGIYGNNGSGKSTFLNLVAGLLQSSEGKITIDGKYNLYENRESWFKNISCVQQDIFLLDESIRYNITFQNELAYNQSRLDEVYKILNLDKYFGVLPNKLSTQVGTNGMSLSGGQKQIISIARALYKDSSIFIFDEPTSAMDATNILLIKDLIHKLKNNKTIILITHDKTFFSDLFDIILKVDAGNIRIVEKNLLQ
jgi:ABC-type bacteriocin/lantibiotic exporter with double-glycine peptidase domain